MCEWIGIICSIPLVILIIVILILALRDGSNGDAWIF